jgi:hypothetical protein
MDLVIEYSLLVAISGLFPLMARDVQRAELNALCLRRGMNEEQAEKIVGRPDDVTYLANGRMDKFHGRLQLSYDVRFETGLAEVYLHVRDGYRNGEYFQQRISIPLRALEKADPPMAGWPTGDYRTMIAAIQKSGKVVLHEGLPHQETEAEQLHAELKAKKTKKLHDFPFYAELLPLQDDDSKKLVALVCDARSFKPTDRNELLGITKLCGQFHPDYCLEWQDGKQVYRAVFCFGCGEVKFYSGKKAMYYDMQPAACKKFAAILTLYRQNRPKRAEQLKP